MLLQRRGWACMRLATRWDPLSVQKTQVPGHQQRGLVGLGAAWAKAFWMLKEGPCAAETPPWV